MSETAIYDTTAESSYNGNPNLKRKNTQTEWSEEMLNELIRCGDDPIYFIQTYMKIIHVDKGLVPFKLYDYQKEMIKSMKDNRFTIIATARQAGKSTTTCAFILWYILFNKDKTVGLLANKGETAREILGRIQLAYQHLPKWIQHGVLEWNKGSFELENNSRVLAAATSSDAIRGYSINMLFIDEAAFIDNWDEFFTSVYPTISSGESTKVVLVSTPNGLNHFHSLWYNANRTDGPNNGYNPIKVMWSDVPGRGEKWKQDTLGALNFNYEKFAQENEVEFLGSSGTLIAGQTLKNLVHKVPLSKSEGLTIYKNPEAGRNYLMVADCSHGKGFDYSAFSVIDVSVMPYDQVAVYRNNMVLPIEYVEILNSVGNFYNESLILVETNDIGQQVVETLFNDYEYVNVVFSESAGRTGKRMSSGFGSPNSRDLGVRTTKSVKATGCAMLKLLIEQTQFVINDHQTIAELSTFSRKGNSFEAEAGKHDDLVMGLVLFGWLSNQRYFNELIDVNTLANLREKTEQEIMDDVMPFGFISDYANEIETEYTDEGYSISNERF